MNHEINRLLNYGLQNGMIYEDDIDYSANLLVDLRKLDTFEKEEMHLNMSSRTYRVILGLVAVVLVIIILALVF